MGRRSWLELLYILFFAVALALFVRHFILTAYKIPTGSMQPALKVGDFVFASRISYGFRIPGTSWKIANKLPERGDIVVFTYPAQPDINYVKRVIGLPGDRLEIRKNRLILNEKPSQYELSTNQLDNPNAELFQIYRENNLDQSWQVIFEKTNSNKNFGPIVVPEGEVFLMGDNRDASDDSRFWGTVPIGQISGQVIFIWLSLDWQNKWAENLYPKVRWTRIFTWVE